MATRGDIREAHENHISYTYGSLERESLHAIQGQGEAPVLVRWQKTEARESLG